MAGVTHHLQEECVKHLDWVQKVYEQFFRDSFWEILVHYGYKTRAK